MAPFITSRTCNLEFDMWICQLGNCHLPTASALVLKQRWNYGMERKENSRRKIYNYQKQHSRTYRQPPKIPPNRTISHTIRQGAPIAVDTTASRSASHPYFCIRLNGDYGADQLATMSYLPPVPPRWHLTHLPEFWRPGVGVSKVSSPVRNHRRYE